MKLWLVRHARPEIAPGHCYGSTDIPADTAATRDCAAALANALPEPRPQQAPLWVMCSPLQRCRQLADALQDLRPDLRATVDGRLAEMHFGAWENQPWSGIARDELDAWTADFGRYPAGGHGESVSAFMQRVAAALDDLAAATAMPGGPAAHHHAVASPDSAAATVHAAPPAAALWITHAGVIRAATLIAAGRRQLQRADEWPTDAPGFGQWRILDWPQEVHNQALAASRPAGH
ncbi:MAG: phosphoglycerate kinase [Comamonadaceae bacterium]|nr:MAG: phosphoglycerate kinase [Comamonadaceae bacterium]